MSTVKEIFIKLIEAQPDDSNADELLRELLFAAMIERGLRDSDAGETVSHAELKENVKQGRK